MTTMIMMLMVSGRLAYVLRWKKLKELRSYSDAMILAPEAPLRTIAIETIFMLSSRIRGACLGGADGHLRRSRRRPPANEIEASVNSPQSCTREGMCVGHGIPIGS